MRVTKRDLIAWAALLSAVSVGWSDLLQVDNLTVSSNTTIFGELNISTNTSGTNYVSVLTVSSNGVNQKRENATNVFLGKVGVGTNNPAVPLHIAGNFRVDSAMTVQNPGNNLPMGSFTNRP